MKNIIKTCPQCGYTGEIQLDLRCPRCSYQLINLLLCKGNCSKCKEKDAC